MRSSDWDSVLASIGHGGLKEGQVINKMLEEREQEAQEAKMTDARMCWTAVGGHGTDVQAWQRAQSPRAALWSRGSMTWQSVFPGAATRFRATRSWALSPGAAAFPSTGQTASTSSTCPEDRAGPADRCGVAAAGGRGRARSSYSTEIKIYANNRIGMFVDISKVFTERQIDITSMNVRTSKQGKATIIMTFDIHGMEELEQLDRQDTAD